MMRDIIRFGSRKILLYIAAAVVVGLVVSYAVLSVPDSPERIVTIRGTGYMLVAKGSELRNKTYPLFSASRIKPSYFHYPTMIIEWLKRGE